MVGASDYSALPKDKVDAANQIKSLQQSVTEVMQRADELAGKADDEKIKNTELQKELDVARREVEEAKSAKPDRYKIVKEGFRTWRLDSATGSLCLLLSSDEDWKDPKMAAQGCAASP